MKQNFETFVSYHEHDPRWQRRRDGNPYFESDLRRALAGDPSGFREIAFYGACRDDIPFLVKDLWRAGMPMYRLRKDIKKKLQNQSAPYFAAFGDDLDAFLRDIALGKGRLSDVIDVWHGGSATLDVTTTTRCWTTSYSIACGFVLQDLLWRNASMEKIARECHRPEPLVVTRRVTREMVAAWIGGAEREVILSKVAFDIPVQPYGNLPEWRRRRCRKTHYFF